MKAFFTLMLTFWVSLSIAQTKIEETIKQNSILINVGQNQFKDENLHPKVFRGLNVGTTYIRTKIKKNISEYSTGLNISLINTTYEEFPSAFSILLKGNYKYLFSVVANEKVSYFIGPVTDMHYGTNAYFNWDESHLYFANYICGGIANRINYKMGKYKFDFNLDIPFISGISRPKPNRQYKIDDITFIGIMKNLASNPELALPNKNFYVKTGLELKYSTTKLRNRSIGYNFLYHFMNSINGKPYQNIEHSISYKFIF